MFYSLIYPLHNEIMKDIKTNNIFYDMLISYLIIYTINYLHDKIISFNLTKKYLNYYINLFFNNNISCEIIIEAQNVISERCNVKIAKFMYSKTFQAITYYIKKNNLKGVYSKREPDKNERESNPVFDLFIPDQTKPFLIYDNIYCNIKIYEDVYETNKDKMELNKKHIIKLFSYDKNIQISYIEDFIDKCLDIYTQYTIEKSVKDIYYFCYVNSDDGAELLNFNEKIFNTNRTFKTIFFEQKEEYLKKLDFFINNQEWYNNKGIPYHLGILLHGLPGTGKTSIIKATLERTGRNAITIPLSRVKTCGELENIFFENEINHKNIPTNKRIYIFEDIDCLCDIVKNREIEEKEDNKKGLEWEILSKLVDDKKKITINPEDELNLSCILNIFDGIIEMPGRIIIITTNYPEKIDKALLRHGRIDLNMELKKASNKITFEILSSFYEINIENILTICNNYNYNIGNYLYTPAYIINVCQSNIDNLERTLFILNE
jgi:hypothetical protein